MRLFSFLDRRLIRSLIFMCCAALDVLVGEAEAGPTF